MAQHMTASLGSCVGLLSLALYILPQLPKLQQYEQEAEYGSSAVQVRLAASILADASVFAPGPVGPGAATTDQQLAWHRVVWSPEWEQVSVALANGLRMPGRLWGLAGLRLRNSALYDKAAAPLRNSSALVEYQYGCIIGLTTTVGAVVAALDSTPHYAARLLGGDWTSPIERAVPAN